MSRIRPVSSTAFEAGRSLGLPSEHRHGALAFATLFALESLARALTSTVISVQAFDLLQNNQRVSMLFTIIGIGGLAATLAIPVLVRLTARRWVYTGGIVLLMAAGA
ncbi:MAG TPA: hypothetical protein VKA79_14980, partial [Aestuariivirgaceae bacterium]|nr:hypothetical protein [Aestuariivirgaceae bacterium]